MKLCGIDGRFERIPAPLPIRRAVVDRAQWADAANRIKEAGGWLVSVWGTDRRSLDGHFAVCAAYGIQEGLVWLSLPVEPERQSYPDVSAVFPAAARMQRAVHDLLGLSAEGASDERPWLHHGLWPDGYFPLREDATGLEDFGPLPAADYRFTSVEGEGVHEIPVGPVHAGIIEPGHFRFSVVGEKVLRLEERLGYKHKGIEKLFERLPPLEGHRLAGRVSGDSTVAYAWAYCMALEAAAGWHIPERAHWIRALMLERERIANHLGDLGALGNDVALAFGLAQFSRLKEDWLRLNKEVFGHRFMMDGVVPGGTATALDEASCARIRTQCDALEREVRTLKSIYNEHAGLQDRFMSAGRVAPELAAMLGLCGLAGRASAQAYDLRVNYPWPPYDRLSVRMATRRNGDVAARVAVRFKELFESLRLIRRICAELPAGPAYASVDPVLHGRFGAGWIEGWRGEILITLELDGQGGIRRCHCHDPSWQNWPLLEHAVIGNIVPDFPLINKSFNLSYAGHDV
jgi:Ni,Fe-hydrogenase III large subunit/Ni,Fe-hydrogenase III component G